MRRAAPVTAPVTTLRHRPLPVPEAWVFRGPEEGFEHIAVPDVHLHPGDLLVQIDLATVCGSDRHTVSGARTEATPLVLGHEQVGRIVALGPGPAPRTVDDHPLAIGDRVVWGVAVACRTCRRCTRGMPQKCETLRKYGHARMERGWELSGGLATHVHVRGGSDIVRVPDDVPDELAAPSSCATATVMAALAAAEAVRSLTGELVVVTGCGMLGLTAIAAARARGAIVVGVDPAPAARALARQFGAAATADTRPSALRDALARVTRSETSLNGAAGFGAALELSGAPSALSMLLSAADVGAVVVLAGSVFPAPAVPVSAEGLTRGLLTLVGVHNYRGEHLREAIDFLRSADRTLFRALVGEVVPFADLDRALRPPRAGARTGIRPSLTSDSR